MNFYSTAESISLAPAEKAQVKAATARIKAAESFSVAYGDEGSNGERSVNQLKIAELAEKFKAKPSAEIAAEIAKHALLHEASKAVSGHFGGICAALRDECSKALFPLAQELTARTIAELDKQLAAAVDGLAKIDGMEDAIADIRARHRRQVEIGNFDVAELADRPGCALPWIANNFEAAV
jgi:hypothetical protein